MARQLNSILDHKHPTLGVLTGLSREGGVAQFRGVRYATLAHRFAPPVLCNKLPTADCTTFGPMSPQATPAIALEWGLIGKELPTTPEEVAILERQSETECLSLNITVPQSALDKEWRKKNAAAGLPVMVYIHGGAYTGGASSWPQSDLSRLVQQSIEMGKPVIAVNINYRLNVAGFITIPGRETNRGLRDQKVAFKWLHANISGFGGDPSRITASGQSAGGISVALQLRDPEPLFARALCMSGEATVFQAAPKEVHAYLFESVCKALGLEGKTEAEKVKALETMDMTEMVAKVAHGVVPFIPMVDGDVLRAPIDLPDVANKAEKACPGKIEPGWCEDTRQTSEQFSERESFGVVTGPALMIGDVRDDGCILDLFIGHKKDGVAGTLATHLKTSLASEALAEDVLSKYGIGPDTPDDEAYQATLNLMNDLAFYVPAVMTARGWPDSKPAYVYHFNCLNSWPGHPLSGKSNHILDMVYLFGTYREVLSEQENASAKAFAGNIISYVNGEEPWARFGPEKEEIMVYGQDGAVIVGRDKEEKQERRKHVWELVDKIGAKELQRAVLGFMV